MECANFHLGWLCPLGAGSLRACIWVVSAVSFAEHTKCGTRCIPGDPHLGTNRITHLAVGQEARRAAAVAVRVARREHQKRSGEVSGRLGLGSCFETLSSTVAAAPASGLGPVSNLVTCYCTEIRVAVLKG